MRLFLRLYISADKFVCLPVSNLAFLGAVACMSAGASAQFFVKASLASLALQEVVKGRPVVSAIFIPHLALLVLPSETAEHQSSTIAGDLGDGVLDAVVGFRGGEVAGDACSPSVPVSELVVFFVHLYHLVLRRLGCFLVGNLGSQLADCDDLVV